MSAPDRYYPTRLRSLSRIVRAEARITDATEAALTKLGGLVRDQLALDAYTATVLDNRAPEWRAALAQDIMPLIAEVYDQGFRSEARPALTAAVMPSGEPLPGFYGPADHLATQYLADVHNRMVGVADDVFRTIAASLEEGRQAEFSYTDPVTGEVTTTVGESIPEMAKRVDALLDDGQRWKNRGRVVARTEVIGANNAGSQAAAYGNAHLFGTDESQVVKQWLATADHRTRESHQAADGQQVMGLNTPFSVGGASLMQPGDPGGPAGEVVNCRCTSLYHYPGDPDYPTDLAPQLAVAPPTGGGPLLQGTGDHRELASSYAEWTRGAATTEQREAFTRYTQTNAYQRWNPHLRGQAADLTEKDLRQIDEVRSMIETSPPLTSPVSAFRGVRDPEAVFGAEAMAPGSVFTDQGFVSTTMDESVMDYYKGTDGGATVSVLIPGGRRVAVAETEAQVLLGPGTKFRVVSDTQVEEVADQAGYDFLAGQGLTPDEFAAKLNLYRIMRRYRSIVLEVI